MYGGGTQTRLLITKWLSVVLLVWCAGFFSDYLFCLTCFDVIWFVINNCYLLQVRNSCAGVVMEAGDNQVSLIFT